MYETLCLNLDSLVKSPPRLAGNRYHLITTIYFFWVGEWQRGKTLIKTPAAETHLKPKTHISLSVPLGFVGHLSE